VDLRRAAQLDNQDKGGISIKPRGASRCVVVFHEVWGLVEHTEDVCKRLSKLGFASSAPNLYRGNAGLLTPDNIQAAMEGVWDLSLEDRRDRIKVTEALNQKEASRDVRETVSLLYDPDFRDGLLRGALASIDDAQARFAGVTTMGFCMGGGLSLKCAAKNQQLKSAISFYGEPPPTEEVAKISAPILDIHANQDELINRKVPSWVEAMLDGGKDLTLKTYPRTKHGFFNDTRKEVYDRTAAAEAWGITRWFLERTLGRH
jgi:carboxymethylenebutenolidase